MKKHSIKRVKREAQKSKRGFTKQVQRSKRGSTIQVVQISKKHSGKQLFQR